MEAVSGYLSGNTQWEQSAVRTLRAAGERAARRLGMQAFEVDAVGVDFAAFMLTTGAPEVRQEGGNIRAYVSQAARWFASKQLRAQGDREVALEEVELVQADPGPEVVSEIARQQLLHLASLYIQSLPDEDQQLYELCIVQDLGPGEAAEQLGCTAGAARKRLQRLREFLRRELRSAIHELVSS